MGREFHVRFREGLGVKVPRATRRSKIERELGWQPKVSFEAG